MRAWEHVSMCALKCRGLGGLEAWGLHVESLRAESAQAAIAAEEACEAVAGSANNDDLVEDCPEISGEAVIIRRGLGTNADPAVLLQFENALESALQLPATVRDATLGQV